MRHDELIDALSQDLRAVSPPVNINGIALIWLIGSSLYVIAITHAIGPIRSNAIAQLFGDTWFLLETVLGIAAIFVMALRAQFSADLEALHHPCLRI